MNPDHCKLVKAGAGYLCVRVWGYVLVGQDILGPHKVQLTINLPPQLPILLYLLVTATQQFTQVSFIFVGHNVFNRNFIIFKIIYMYQEFKCLQNHS